MSEAAKSISARERFLNHAKVFRQLADQTREMLNGQDVMPYWRDHWKKEVVRLEDNASFYERHAAHFETKDEAE